VPAADGVVPAVAKFDLSLTAGASAGGLVGGLEFATDLFEAATAARLVSDLMSVLAAVATDPGRRLVELPLSVAAAPVPVVAELPAVGGVHELITGASDKVAVVCGRRSLTYAGLRLRAERLAARLRAEGVGAESVVGVQLPRGVDVVVGMLGTWLAGAAFVPLDPEYPAERREFMVADAGVSVVLSDVDGADGYKPIKVDPQQLAYVIYTSGSTGRPKGVHMTHGGLVNAVAGLGSYFRGRVLQFAAFGFDASVLDVAATLAGGGTLVIAGAGERSDVGRLVRASGVEAMSVVP
jgi:non-ribosomal peptide synthetase component F